MVTYPTAIHLCSGYGGFELALRPWNVRTVCHVERDSYAAAILMERMAQSRLDQAPIWDDLTTFDGEPWCGRVDIITAGFPCQPFSSAGAQRGLDDDRWLWPAIARIIAKVRPRFVVLENVPPVVRSGLPAVLSDLAQLGFNAEWGLYSAADVGAPHRRQRWWCAAYATGNGSHTVISTRDGRSDVDRSGRGARSDETEPVADPSGTRRKDDRADREQSALGDAARSGSVVADTNSRDSAPWDGSRENQRSRRRTNIQSGSDGIFPPTRDDTAAWSQWISEGRPEPVVRRDTDGPPAGLADALHLGGNGLVPQTATEAIRQLLHRAGWEIT